MAEDHQVVRRVPTAVGTRTMYGGKKMNMTVPPTQDNLGTAVPHRTITTDGIRACRAGKLRPAETDTPQAETIRAVTDMQHRDKILKEILITADMTHDSKTGTAGGCKITHTADQADITARRPTTEADRIHTAIREQKLT